MWAWLMICLLPLLLPLSLKTNTQPLWCGILLFVQFVSFLSSVCEGLYALCCVNKPDHDACVAGHTRGFQTPPYPTLCFIDGNVSARTFLSSIPFAPSLLLSLQRTSSRPSRVSRSSRLGLSVLAGCSISVR